MVSTEPEASHRYIDGPIIFRSQIGPPDVRFTIFRNEEFHVHSAVLKMYSAFFLKFLDPLNKDGANTPASTSGFKYEWVSEMDADGKDWHMVSASSCSTTDATNAAFEPADNFFIYQIRAFHNLLRAFYHTPLEIEDATALNAVTDMADYYRCLPILSHAFDASFLKNDYFEDLDPEEAALIIESAVKLRNTLLFKDCAVLCVGDWPRFAWLKEYKGDKNDRLCKVLKRVMERLGCTIAREHSEMMAFLMPSELPGYSPPEGLSRYEMCISDMRRCVEWAAISALRQNSGRNSGLPTVLTIGFFRQVSTATLEPDTLSDGLCLRRSRFVDALLRNRLKLNPQAVSGAFQFEGHFLCAEVTDDDLPWDVNDISMDW